jgi:hypothetical protein
MSEPVGNAPRNPSDIPGNSHRERTAAKAPSTPPVPAAKQEKDEVKQIAAGKVRKTPWYKRFGRSLIADDVTNIREWIMVEVVVPSIRNLLADSIKGSTDRVLYGQSRARGRGYGYGGYAGGIERPGLRTRYDKMSEGEPRRMLSREARARHDFGEVTLDSRTEADAVIDALIHRVEQYGVATISDLYDLVGVTGSYADQNYGWTDLRSADVRQERGGWTLDLPPTELLR